MRCLNKILAAMSLAIAPVVSLASLQNFAGEGYNFDFENSQELNTVTQQAADNQTVGEYIGYGYNVTKGKAISEPDALNLTAPILDLTNDTLRNNIRTFESSQTTYESNSSTSARNIAEQYGKLLSGGVDGKIAIVSLGINGKFNTVNSFQEIQKEEYSYYSIYVKNNTIVLQLDEDVIRTLLNSSFQNALYNVNSIASAKNLYEKYGTHLLRGYIEGGIFEMTNYFASDEYNYVKENSVSFAGQVSAGMSANNVGADFSFNQTYASKDNNAHAINQYKCTTYGGRTFPGLTIDQAFTYYETAFEAGYIYQLWTDSINDDVNLVIVDVPQSSPLMPLWELLPSDSEYNDARAYLTQAYSEICDTAYTKFNNEFPSIYPTDINEDLNDDIEGLPEVDELGYDYSLLQDNGTYLNSYVSCELNNTERYEVEAGSQLSFDAEGSELIGRKITYSTQQNSLFSSFDTETGNFKLSSSAKSGTYFEINVYCDGVLLGRLSFKVADAFSGGDGSEENPYLIANRDNLIKLTKDSSLWGSNYHYKLVGNIDLDGEEINMIGTTSNPFKGTFDGNYYTISNARIKLVNDKSIGLFGTNSGTIRNVYFENDESRYKNDFRNYLVDNTTNFKYFFENAGGLVGYNTSSGVIENVHLKNLNLKLEYNNTNSNVSSGSTILSMGGICGKNEGKITSSTLTNSNLMARGDYINNVNCGGIVGFNESKAPISKCVVDDCSIYSRSGIQTSDYVHFAYAGGIVALTNEGNVENCLVKDIDGNERNEKEGRIISLARGTEGNRNLASCAGGLVGFIEGVSSKIITSVAFDVATIKSNYAILNGAAPADNIRERCGILIGFFYMNSSPSELASYINNVYVESQPNTPIAQSYNTSECSGIDGLNIVTNLTYNSLSSSFIPSIWINDGGLPYIDFVSLQEDKSQYIFDYTYANLTFYVGDAFTVGGLEVKTYLSNGETIEIDNYYVDSSDFRSDVPGEYEISIYVYDVVETYKVKVIDPKQIELKLVKEPTRTDYFVGEEFDPSGIELNVVKENGDVISLDENDITYTKNKFVEGVNTIKISYGTLSLNYQVIAKPRIVSSIEIVELPNTLDYEVGVTNLDLTGLKVKVNFEDGGNEIVNENDPNLDVIFTQVYSGENTVVVTYNSYKYDTFTVFGNDDYETIAEFVSLVDDVVNETDLEAKFELIKQAYQLKEKITSTSNASFVEASQKLEEEVVKYNALVSDVNSDSQDVFNSFLNF